jgi:hypothetical protein
MLVGVVADEAGAALGEDVEAEPLRSPQRRADGFDVPGLRLRQPADAEGLDQLLRPPCRDTEQLAHRNDADQGGRRGPVRAGSPGNTSRNGASESAADTRFAGAARLQ